MSRLQEHIREKVKDPKFAEVYLEEAIKSRDPLTVKDAMNAIFEAQGLSLKVISAGHKPTRKRVVQRSRSSVSLKAA